jgi:N6-L-threonylcarbamoyladenine synthase
MKKYVLGIESSCDETAVSVVSDDKKILSNVVYSQIKEHKDFGGVVPEIAARSHLDSISWVIKQAMLEANITFKDLSAVAGVSGPGLIGGLLVGMQSAKAIAFANNIPFIAINHLEAHALTARLTNDVSFPFLLLLVSGGHTQILQVNGVGDYKVIGKTLDDAVGEAFDKTAKILNIGYPGGPELEKRAKLGNPNNIKLPSPMVGKQNCDFSFSGLKTRVRHLYDENKNNINQEYINDMCASFQVAVAKSINNRLEKSFKIFRKNKENKKYDFVIAGGVASNLYLRDEIKKLCEKNNFEFNAPPVNLCTDNGVMIAWAGVENLQINNFSSFDMPANPRWNLEELRNEK